MKISERTIDAVKQVSLYDLAVALGDTPKKKGSWYIGSCPNPAHRAVERTPDTGWKISTNRFKCFGGSCGIQGGPIDYYVWRVYGTPYDPKTQFVDAIHGIANLMGIPIKYDEPPGYHYHPTQQQPTSNYQPPERPPEVISRSPEDCDRVYRAFLMHCPIYREHAEELLGPKRQYTQDEVLAIGFRSVPRTFQEAKGIIDQLLQEGFNLERIPGFTQRLMRGSNPEDPQAWYWTFNAPNDGYFIPVRDEYGQIIRLRVATKIAKSKYIWFSSEPTIWRKNGQIRFVDPKVEMKQENYHLMQKGGCSSGAPFNVVVPAKVLPFWTPGMHFSDLIKTYRILITEGEHKSYITANRLGIVVIGIPGVGIYRPLLSHLENWNVKETILAYDMDSLQTVEEQGNNENVFKVLVDFSKELIKSNNNVILWTWDIAHGKGIDDLLLHQKIPVGVQLPSGIKVKVNL